MAAGGRAPGAARRRRLKLEDVQARFSMPAEAAARDLGVSARSFRRQCRVLGIARWPHRLLTSKQGWAARALARRLSGAPLSAKTLPPRRAPGPSGSGATAQGQAAAVSLGGPEIPTPRKAWAGCLWDGGKATVGDSRAAEPPSVAPPLPLRPLEPVPTRVSQQERQRMAMLVSQLSMQQVAHTLCGLSLGLLCGARPPPAWYFPPAAPAVGAPAWATAPPR